MYYFKARISLLHSQAKLRLEMEMERQRQTHSKDIESKDEEVDEIRRSCSKKVTSCYNNLYTTQLCIDW